MKQVSETERARSLKTLDQKPQVTDKELARLRVAVLNQMGEDFRKIQIVDNEMIRGAALSQVLDYDLISRQAAQIKARANSLKTSLALPDLPLPDASATAAKKDQPNNISDRELVPQLVSLDKVVRHFVTNPIFRESKVVDLNLSAQASADLKNIIELSENVRKNAARLVRPH